MSDDDYEVIDEHFEFGHEWIAANPVLGQPPTATFITEEYERALTAPPLTRNIAEGVWRGGRGVHADRVILDESMLGQLRDFASSVKFELLEWQEEACRRMFGLDVVDDVTTPAFVSGPMYLGPVGALYDECTTGPFLDAAAWDAVPRTPRADPEMLNRVIDDIETDVTAKIARTECPRFPRAE